MSAAPQAPALRDELRGYRRRALLVGAVALVVTVLAGLAWPRALLGGWLFAWWFWLGPALGSLAVVLLHQLTGGSWGFAVRRLLEAGMRTLPLLALLMLPILLGVRVLFPWADPEAVAADPLLQHKEVYLNVPFALGRAVGCFALLIGLAWWLLRLAARYDRTLDGRAARRMRVIAGPGLALYVLAMTLLSVDWSMSLDPHWFSTIYGLKFVIGQVLTTLALAILAAAWLARREPFARWLSPDHFHDLGNLLFAFVMLWAYVALSQFLIIWSGNIAEETPWYIARTHHGWQAIALLLVLFHFAVPFVLLLMRRTKRKAQWLSRLAAGLLVMRVLDLYWIVGPHFHEHGVGVPLLELGALVGIGGLWLALFLRSLEGRPLLSLQDARLTRELEDRGTSPAGQEVRA